MDTSLKDRRSPRSALLELLVNPIIVVVKRFVGFVGDSCALIADDIESTHDIFFSLRGQSRLKFTSRKPAGFHTFGNGKAELIPTTAVTRLLFAPGFTETA